METRKFIIGKDAAAQFAKEHCNNYQPGRVLEDVEHEVFDERDRTKYSRAFALDRFSELVEVYEFRYDEDGNKYLGIPPHWYLESTYFAVKLLSTGELMRPYKQYYNASGLGLTPLFHDYRLQVSEFKFDEQQPRYVGRASASKVGAWFDYHRKRKEAMMAYVNDAYAKNRKFQEVVKAKFPDAYMNITESGWMSECSFVYHDFVKVHYTALENGNFYRSLSIDGMKFPNDKVLLGRCRSAEGR